MVSQLYGRKRSFGRKYGKQMTLEIIFMALTLTILVFIAYLQFKTYVVTQVTLVGLVDFLQSLEDQDYGETQQFH